jgi:hypothetical protein
MPEQLEMMTRPVYDDPIFSDLNTAIVGRWWLNHKENPQTYDLFKKFALDALRSGRKRFGAQAIFERVRWYTQIETVGEFKVNNSHISCYTRLLILEDPRFADFFETRHTPGTL